MQAKTRRKLLTYGICGVTALSLSLGAFLLFGRREAESAVISAGLQQLADDAYVACSAKSGQSISFTPEWFDDTLQGGAVSAITVTSLPKSTEGVLMLGGRRVGINQKIERKNLTKIQKIQKIQN